MRNVYESLNKASISKYLLNKAMLYSLALLFIAAQGCSSGSDAVDKFLGDAEVPDPEVTYSLDLDPATHDFGLVLTVDPVPKTQVVTVKNTMTVPLFISSVVGDASADFTLLNETCSATMVGGLLPSQTCTFTVQFDPTTAGNLAYSVNINFGPAATDTTSVARGSFLGTGATPANLLVSESPLYDFGAVVMTGFAEKTLMITNLGTWPATTVVGDGLSAPFSYKGGVYPGVGGTCGATIGGSASCSIVIEFNPPATGLSTDTIEVSYFDGDQNQVSTRDIQGTGATPASLSVTGAPFFDYGTIAVGATSDATFTVTNSGGVPATSVSGAGLSAPYSFKGGTFPGTGGTCGATIVAGDSCTVVISFAPTVTGLQLDTFDINYHDGLVVQTINRDLQGTAVPPAALAISDGPIYDYSSKIVGSSTDHTFTVTNGGGLPATNVVGGGLNSPFNFKGGSYPGTGGTCPLNIAAGATCTIVITYAPTSAGGFNDTIELAYGNGVSTVQATRNIQASAVTPANLTINRGPLYDFGIHPTGSSTDEVFTVSNSGGTPAASIVGGGLAVPFDFKGGTYPGVGGTCGIGLAPGGTCTIVLTYAPVATGAHSDALEVAYDDGLNPQTATRALIATGVGPAVLGISDGPTYNYGTQPIGGSIDKTLTVSNTGGFPASAIVGSGLVAPFTFKGGTFPGTGGTCTTSLNAAASCTVIVTVQPTSTGLSSGQFDLAYNDGVSAQTTNRPIQVTGVTPASLTISDGPTFDYGPVATGAVGEKTFTINNVGQFTASAITGGGLSAPFAFKGGTFPGTGGTCGTSLNAAASCTIIVTFSPVTTGTLSDAIDMTYNNGVVGQAISRAIQGVGTTPATLAFSDGPTYNFGSIPYGATLTKTITVTNVGGVPASAMVGGGIVAPFTFLGGSYPGTGGTCGASIAASANCTIVVEFAPLAAGTFTDTVEITYFDTVATQTSGRALSGTAVNPANLLVSGGPTYDFDIVAVGGSKEVTLTVSNTGQFVSTTMSGGGLAAPYSFKGGTYPGTGGTCAVSLTASATCTIVVVYSPTATGIQLDTIDIAYFNGVSNQTSSRNLQGTGAAPALLGLSDGPSYDYGTIAAGGTADHTFTMNNTGGVTATGISGGGLAPPYNFKGGTYPGVGGTCASSLSASASCTMVITFNPSAIGVSNDTVVMSYNDGANPANSQRDIQGTAVAPASIAISDGPAYDFGSIPITGSIDKVFNIQNTGAVPATSLGGSGLSAPFTFKGGTFPGAGGTCGSTLNPSAICSVVVTFAPTTVGTHTKTLTFNYNNGVVAASSSRDMQGVGAPPGNLSISDGPTYSFGSWPSGAVRSYVFTVTNTGGVGASAISGGGLAAPFLFKGGAYPGAAGTCGSTLAPASSCTIEIEFSPTTVNTFSDAIELTYNNGLAAGQVSSRGIQGIAVAPASITISNGAIYDFGTLATGASADKTFTVTNSGGYVATTVSGTGINAPFVFKGGSFPGAGGSCTTSLNAGASCTVVVTYAPSSTGAQSDTIEINYFDGVNNQLSTRGVQGIGAAPALLGITDGPAFNFGTFAVGGTVDKSFTISNSGGVTATAISGSGLAAPFSFKGGTYPGTGGTCGATLASSASCLIVVTYNPTVAGTQNDTIDIAYTDGVSSQLVSRDISGTSVPPGAITISDATTYNYGTVANGATVDKTFTLTNSGSYSTSSLSGSGLAAPFSFKGGAYPGTGGTCGASLNSGASCAVVVTFAPTASGLHSDTMDINFFDGASFQTSSRPIQGTGAAPAVLSLSDGPTWDYGTKATGSSTDKSFTVLNTGGVPATSVAGSGLAAPFTFKGGTFPGAGGTCTATLAAGANCTIIVTYAPTATGAQSDAIDLAYNDGVTGQTVSRNIQGLGATPASLAISDGPLYDFGSHAAGGTVDKTFTLSNSGGVSATSVSGGGIAAPFTFKGGAYPGTGGTCTATLPAGASCTFVVNFSPTGAGTLADTIEVTYTDGVTPQVTSRDVQGTGVTPAQLTISDGASFNFGAIANTASSDKVFTIQNTGSINATSVAGSGLANPFSFKGGSFPGTGGNCGATLNSGASCQIVVTFNPTSSGSYSDSIDIAYFDGANSQTAVRAIQGVGAPPANLTVSDGPTFNYNQVANGSINEKSFTITNAGGVTATTISGAGLGAPYTYKGGVFPGTGGTCTATLNAAATCTAIVVFNPTSLGVHNSTMTVNYFNGLSAQASNRAITGTSVAPASLSLSDGPTYDYGTKATGSSTDKTFTITNSGAFTASSMSGGGIAAPFAFKGGTYPGTGGSCTSTLNASATCTIVVTYSPSATGAQNDSIDISYYDGAAGQLSSVAVQGTGAAPALLAISDGPTYTYGTFAIGSSTDKTFTVTNTGGVPATAIAGSGLASPFAFKGGSYPGTAGTCTASLNAGASCTMVITYSPTAAGLLSDTVNLAYNDGVTTQTESRDLQGTGAVPAQIAISDGATYNYNTHANGASVDKTFTLTNTGNFTASTVTGSGLAAPFSFKGGSYPGTGGTCGASINASATCTIVVTFAPTVSGLHSDAIDINFYDGAANQTSSRNIQGTGAAPASLAVSDGPTYDFGTRATGSTLDKTFTVTNSGGVPATSVAGSGLAAPFTFKGGSYPGTGGTCAATLAASDTCTVVVTYAPTGTGSQTDTLDITYNNGVSGQTASRDVQGVGAAPASLSISDSPSYDFGSLAAGGFAEKTFTVSNSGGVTASGIAGSGLAAPFLFKGASYPGTGGTCGATLVAGGTCTIVVRFAPSAAGAFSDDIDINYSNGVSAQSTSRTVQGTAVTPAQLAISDGPTYDYGSVPQTGSVDKVFTVTNGGSINATSMVGGGLAAPYVYKGGSYPGTGGTCGPTLNAGNSCTIVVTFTPTALGSASDDIDIAYFDGALNQNALRAVQGNGALPSQLTISDGATYNYGNVANGSVTEKTFTVTNGGGVPATAISGGGLAAPFSFKGGTFPGTGGTCTATLAATASCQFIVVYNPTAVATHNDTIDISFHDGLTTQTSSRALTGTSVPPASLAVSDGPTYDFGTVATGAVVEKTLTVTNSGSFTASGMGGGGLAAPFSFKGGAYPGTGGTCSTTLSASGSCTIVVRYAPSATGLQSDNADVTYYDGANNQTASRALQGTGATPALLAISDGPTFNYGTFAVGASSDKTFIVTNSGGVGAVSMNGGGLAAPFSFKGGTYPGTGGTCGATLASGSTCSMVVTYAPSAVGSQSDTIDLAYNDGAAAQTSSRDIQGTAAAPASISISDGATWDYGTKANGSSADKTFTLSNTGSFAATGISGGGLAAPFSFKGGAYPGTAGTCGVSLNAGATCTVVVTFAPTIAGLHSDAIDINYNDGAAAQTSSRAVQGTGAGPASLAISDGPSYDFGTRATTSTLDKSFTVTNSGGVPATSVNGSGLAAPFSFKGGTYPGTGGTCGATIAASATCSIVVTYAPTATGAQGDSIDIGYDDGVTVQSVSRSVQGIGAAPALLGISDGPSYNYGTIAAGGALDKTFTITNSGGVAATSVLGGGLAAPFTFKGASYPGTGGTCGATLAAAASCTVVVTYNPAAAGVHTDNIDITYHNGAASGQSISRQVDGTAVTPAQLAITDGPTYDYGAVPSTGSVDKIFTVSNSGSVNATVMSGAGLAAPFTFKGGSYPGAGGNCGASLNSGSSCTIVVTFNPTSVAPFSDTIDIPYFDGAQNQTASRAIQGTGATPASLAISDGATYNYGTLANGSVTEKTFTVSNSGGVPATGVAGAGLAAPFTFKGGTYPGTGATCTATLAAAANCTIIVVFNPTSIALHTDTIDINYNNGLSAQTAQRDVQGTAVAPALLGLSDGPTYDFGTIATGATVQKTITVTNSGAVTASGMNGSGLAAPFAFKGGSYPGAGGNCGTSLGASASCSIVVTYSPTATGLQSDTIDITYNDGASAQTAQRALQGTGAAPALLGITDGPTYAFGTYAVGGVAEKTFTVTNSGGVGASSMSGSGLAAPYSFKGGTYPGTGGSCAATLAAGATCSMVVVYSPSAVGTHTDTIDLAYNDGAAAQTSSRDLTGTAVTPASLSITDGPTYNYGTLANGATADKTFTVSNGGNFAASSMSGGGLAAPFTYKGGTYPGTGGSCGLTLNPAASCTVVVTFAPTVSGLHPDAIDISYNDGAAGQVASRNVQGTGAAPANISVTDGPTYSYGTRATGSTLDKTFTVSNSGGVDATSFSGSGLTAPFSFKGGSYPGTGGTCGSTLSASASCTVVVTYAPTATGAHADAIDFAFNDGVSAQTVSRNIAGTGAAPALIAITDGPTYNFGSLAAGGSAEKTFTVSNSGGVDATGMSGGGLAAPFTFKGASYPGTGGDCSSSLTAGGSCTIVVVYNPSAAGSHSDSIDIAYNNGVSAQSSSRAVQGSAVTPAIFNISDGPTYDYGAVVTTVAVDKTFTITNSGAFNATSMSASGIAAPFTFKGGTYPGTGGNCGSSLNASSSCTIVVTFTPSALGNVTDTIDFSYFDGAVTQSASRDIQGTGATVATLSVSDGATYDYGSVANGGSVDKTFTVTNGGGVTATSIVGSGLAAPFLFKGGSYPGTGGTCLTYLAAADTCTIVVTYSPTSIATHNDTIDLTFHNGQSGGQTANRALQGTGVPPANLAIDGGPTYDFGTAATGATVEHTFTVSNSGSVSATGMSGGGLAAPFAFKGGSYPGTGGTCAATLTAGANCSIVVTYAPSATGVQSDTIDIAYNNGAGSQTSSRNVQGTGAAPALLSLSDGPAWDYGAKANGSSTDKTITITNSGGVSATGMSGGGLAAPFSFKGGGYPGAGGTCVGTLGASATCTIVVTFNPTTTGSHSDTIDIAYTNGVSGQTASRDIQGTSTAPASLTINLGATFNFGAKANGSSTDQSFTITNGGAFTATAMGDGSGLAAPYTFKGGSYPGAGGNCGISLAPAGTCTIVVTFAPTGSGTHNDSIEVTYNDGAATQSASRAVTGTSTAPASLSINLGATFDYGTKATGSSTDQAFVVTNGGGFDASSMGGSGLAAPFSFKGGSYPGVGGDCGATLAASGTCTIVVTYAPSATGAQSDTIDIGYNNGVSAQTASRGVSGTGAAPALIAISDGPTWDYGTKATGSATDKTFTLSNSGGVSATGMSGGGLAAPFAFKGGSFPGVGGNCTATLTASSSCTVVVTFSPTLNGPVSDTLDITYNNGAASQTSSRDIQGTGIAPATLAISDGPTYDYGAVVSTGSADKSFTVTNTGGLTASSIAGSGIAAPFTFKGGSFPGTGGTCGATLNGAATCTIVVTFNPTALGAASDTIDLTYNDGVTSQTSSRDVQGTGATAANLSINGGATYDYGSVAVGSSTDHTFTVTNGGGVAASSMNGSGLAAPYTFKGGTYPGVGGTCGTSLGATLTCTVVVNYSPSTAATHTDTLDMTYNDGLAAQTAQRPLTGTGVPPASLSINGGPTYDFGTIATGGSAEHTFTVTNGGGVAANLVSGGGLAAPFAFKGGAYPGTGGTCTATINNGASCQIVVVYSPSSTGAHSDSIDLSYNDGAANQTASRAVQGTGAAPATLAVSDGPTYNYGAKANGSSTDKSFTITNSGGVTASAISGGGLAAPFAFKGGSFPGTGGTCAATLGAGATCQVVVTFNPTSTGSHSDTIDITYNNGVAAGQSTSRDVQGTSTAPASLTISGGPTYDFGAKANGSSTDQSFTITNGGGFAASSLGDGLGLAAPYTFKDGTYPGTGGNCGISLAASGTCTIVVTFAPTIAGTHNDSIDIAYNDGAANQTASRAVTGTSTAPATIAISDGATYDYGTKATGSSTDKTFTLSNTGSYAASSVAGSGLAAPFSFKAGSFPGTGGTCTNTIAAGNSCTIVVTYAPSGTGAQSDTIDITYNNGASAQTSSRNIQGTGASPGLIAITDGPTYNFGSKATGSATDKTFTLTNSGGVDVTGMSGAGLAAPFGFKGGGYPGTGGTCGASLTPAATCTVVVTFSPTAGVTSNDTLDVTYNNGAGSATSSRDVQGTGVTPASLVFADGASYDFGPVVSTGAVERSFTITNTGGLNATTVGGSGLAAPFTFKGGSYPGTGGTCSATVNSGSSCTIVVRFAPSADGAYSDTIDLAYNDGANNQTAHIDLDGAGAPPASLSINGGATYNYGTFATGSAVDHSFTVTNSGGVAANTISGSGLAAPYAFKGGTFPGTGGTCGATLNAAATCTIVVTYSPTTAVTHNDTLDVTYNDGLAAQTASRPVTGAGVPPASLTISDGPIYDYGTLATGATGEKTFTVTNGGGVAATSMAGTGLAAPFTFKGGSGYPGTGGTCSTSLNPAATCTIVVVWSPTGTGAQSDTIEITYNDAVNNQTATGGVQGTGAAPATLTITDGPTYNYGTLANGASAEKTFTVTNTGGVTATTMSGSGLAAPFTFKGGTYPGTAATCSTSLSAGSSCTIIVVYAPTVSGSHSDTIDITYINGVSSQSISRDVAGTGAAPAVLAITGGPAYDFGAVVSGGSADATLTVSNSGGVSALSITGGGLAAPFSFKGGSYPGSGGTCGATIAASGTCTVVLTFAPGSISAFNDTLDINYNNGVSAQVANRDVQGSGAGPAVLGISDGPTYSYGTRANGSSTDGTLTVSNTGGVTATSLGGTGLAAPYTFKGGTFPGTGGTCTTTLAAAASCTVVIAYSPTTNATHNDTLDINYNNGAVAQTTSRDLTGTAVAAASLSISDSDPYDYGLKANGTSTDKTFTISNTGGFAASGMSGSGLAAPFSFKGGGYPGTGGSCTATLSAGSNCTVVVTYSPTSAGTQSDTMDIPYNNGASAQTASRQVTGTSAAPAFITISDTDPYDYGTLAVGASADRSFTITNTGGYQATSFSAGGLAAPFGFKGGSFPGVGGNCTATINAGASCTIVVTYNPSGSGSHSDSLDITYNNGAAAGQTASRQVQGVGSAPASLTISDGATYDFGAIASTTSTDHTFTVTNSGGVSATSVSQSTLTAPFSYKGGSFPGVGGNCAASIAGASSCTIVVTFAPASNGTYNDTMTLTYNNGVAGGQTASRPIQGTGAGPAVLTISDGATFSFGTVANGSANEKTFTISNSGGVSATSMTGAALSAPYSWKGGGYPGTGGTCSTTLAATQSCSVVVIYNPSTVATHNATLQVNYNNALIATNTQRAMTGTAVAPASVTVSNGPTYAFGTKANGSTTGATLTLTNGGTFAASGMTGAVMVAPYDFEGGSYPGTGGTCGATLAGGGATCTIRVVFQPTSSGAQAGSVSVNYFDGAINTSASRALSGTGAAPALLNIAGQPLKNFGARNIGTTTNSGNITITNAGGFTASLMSGGGIADPFRYTGGNYPGTSGTCGATLGAGATCNLRVDFIPTDSGVFNDTIDISYNDGVTTQSATLDVTGIGLAKITSVTASANATYNNTQFIDFTVVFNAPITVTNTPYLELVVGAATRYANYFTGSGTTTLVFRYDVEVGDLDTNGIALNGLLINENDGTVRDPTNNTPDLTFVGPNLANVRVDGVLPNITGAGMVDDATIRNTKTWTWGCSETCTYRFAVDTNAAWTPAGAYAATNTTTWNTGNGTHYLHVEAKDTAGNVSAVTTVSVVMDTTAPTFTGLTLLGTQKNADPLRARNVSWTGPTDNYGVTTLQIALGYDANTDASISVAESTNVVNWTNVPTGLGATSYRMMSQIDSFTFGLVSGREYAVSVRAGDSAGNYTVQTTATWNITYYPWTIPGIRLWVDASDSGTLFQDVSGTVAIADGTTVGRWLDKSGNNNYLDQGTSAVRPTYRATGWNATSPTVDFALVGGAVTHVVSQTRMSSTAGDMSVYAVLQPQNAAPSSTNASAFGSASNNGSGNSGTNAMGNWQFGQNGVANPNRAWRMTHRSDNDNNTNIAINAAAATYNTNRHMVRLQMGTNGGNATGFAMDGTSALTANIEDTTKSRLFFARLGGSYLNNTTVSLEPKISEFIVLDNHLSQANREKLEGYMACKWGLQANLPGAHPYATANYTCGNPANDF